MTPVSTEPERLYTLDDAARRTGFPSPGALRTFLCRYPDLAERRYRGKGRRRRRFLTESEIRVIREQAVK